MSKSPNPKLMVGMANVHCIPLHLLRQGLLLNLEFTSPGEFKLASLPQVTSTPPTPGPRGGGGGERWGRRRE